jgi:hypothetical protein
MTASRRGNTDRSFANAGLQLFFEDDAENDADQSEDGRDTASNDYIPPVFDLVLEGRHIGFECRDFLVVLAFQRRKVFLVLLFTSFTLSRSVSTVLLVACAASVTLLIWWT